MRHLGRIVGLLAVLAVPVAASIYLYSRPTAAGPVAREDRVGDSEGPRYAPPPLYAGPPQDGVTFALQSEPGRIDVRGFAHLALYVPEGGSASAFLPAGPFVATFKGRLRVPRRDRYTFTFVGTGSLELRIGDHTVLSADAAAAGVSGERVRLSAGEQPLTARYTSPATGPAILRVYWECRDFGREPVPPAALVHDASPSLAQYAALRRGRRLVEEKRCGRCHLGEVTGSGGPILTEAGAWLRQGHMASWILDPDPSRMPRLLHGDSAPQDAADIAAWLATLGRPGPAPEFTGEERELGALRFADYGCIACHTLPDAATVPERVSLQRAAAKFQPAALVQYLKDPLQHFPTGSMPDFGLDDRDARALAAFLTSRSPAPVAAPAGDPERGRRLVGEKGCVACHGLPVENRLRPKESAVTRGGEVECRIARYDLAAGDLDALRSYLTRRPEYTPNPVETVEYEMHRSRCVSCHGWRGTEGRLTGLRAEAVAAAPPDPEASPFRPPPDLTYTGSKLRTEWLVRRLAGGIGTSPRPWMQTRMPRFAIDPETFARGFASAEGFAPSAPGAQDWQTGTALLAATAGEGFDPAGRSDDEVVAIGERLIRRDGGLGCIQCHPVGERPAEEVFEAPGIDLRLAPVRLRKEYYHRWVEDPIRIDPTTKMTRFGDADGLTGLTEVLEGRATAQFEAIWRYLERQVR